MRDGWQPLSFLKVGTAFAPPQSLFLASYPSPGRTLLVPCHGGCTRHVCIPVGRLSPWLSPPFAFSSPASCMAVIVCCCTSCSKCTGLKMSFIVCLWGGGGGGHRLLLSPCPLAEVGGVVAHCDQHTLATAAALFSAHMVY